MRTFYVDTVPGGQQACIQCNQFETGDTWRFQLFYGGGRYDIPAGATVKITGTKADKAAFAVAATVDSNEVVVTVTEQITAAAGRCVAELLIESGGAAIYSANFVIMVEPAAVQGELSTSTVPLSITDADGNVYVQSDLDVATEALLERTAEDQYQQDLAAGVAKRVVEEYTGSTLAGVSQSVKSAIDGLKGSWFNVAHYGIYPDTNEDLYFSLFNFLKNEVCGEGGVVYFPKGTYKISDTIFIPADTVFVGDGQSTKILYTESYTSIGVALSNGGDNCGVMNMTVDCMQDGDIPSGAITGSIGFSTFDASPLATAHTVPATRRNTKNLFARNLWTNTRYIFQAETTSDSHTIEGLLVENIYANGAKVSIQGRSNITDVNVNNVTCAFFCCGLDGTTHNNEIKANNIKCGRAWLQGDITLTNFVLDSALKHDTISESYAVRLAGKVKITNAIIDATTYSYMFSRFSANVQMCNVSAFGGSATWSNNVGSDDPTFLENYFLNCVFEPVGTGTPIINGIASNSVIKTSGDLRNRNKKTITVDFSTNTDISSAKPSAVTVYDGKVVKIYIAIVLRNTSKVCTFPEGTFNTAAAEHMIGYLFNSSTPELLVPCIASIGNSTGDLTLAPLNGAALTTFNRFVMDAVFFLD